MPLTFAGHLDHTAVVTAVDAVTDLVASPLVAEWWQEESVLPGMTVGGLTRHLVSQPECAVEFLAIPPQDHAPVLSLTEYAGRLDWLDAPLGAPENTSIRDDFNAMGAAGPEEARTVLAESLTALPGAVAAAAATTYVPWQDCSLATDDFLAWRLVELVVHADDLAVSLGVPTPRFEAEALEPVLALLALMSARRHGQDASIRALSRAERATGPVSAFGSAGSRLGR